MTQLRPQVEILDGCTLLWREEDLRKAAKTGDAVPVGYPGGGGRIVQHHAANLEEAMKFADGYRHVAASLGCECVFRGQTRDYYTESGVLAVLPSIMRRPELYFAFQYCGKSYWDSVRRWLEVLEDLGVFTGSGISIKLEGRNLGGHLTPGTVFINHPVAVMRRNPVVAGILQHYGFPTDHLDVTIDPAVAMWFALHQSHLSRGRIEFRPVGKGKRERMRGRLTPQHWQNVPTMHVYIQPAWRIDQPGEHPLAYLATMSALVKVARRPVVQSAVSMPFCNFSVSPPNRIIPPRVTPGDHLRWPAAIVKLHFDARSLGREDLTAQTLFPKDEPLYQRLLQVKPEHLAIYA